MKIPTLVLIPVISFYACDSCNNGGVIGTIINPPDGGTAQYYSHLYPPDWTPETVDGSGRFLHDFSYAGYHHGEADLPIVTGPVFDVTDYGAQNNDSGDQTASFQAAIDAAEVGGGVVFVPAGTYRIDGMLRIEASGVVIRGAGTSSRLNFTKTDAVGDQAHLRFVGRRTLASPVELTADILSRGHTLSVPSGHGLSVGDDIEVGWTITPDFIADHDMTGTWGAFNDTWQSFFQRTITGITDTASGSVITVDVPHRYDGLVRDGLAIKLRSGYLTECGLERIALTNAHDKDDAQDNDRNHLVRMDYTQDCWVDQVQTVHIHGDNDGHVQSGGIKIFQSKNITLRDSGFHNAQNRLVGGNGYLVEVSQVSDILIENVEATNGRHNFIQNWGFGATGVVFKDCYSEGSRHFSGPLSWPGLPSFSEFHHSLATANLIDGGEWEDGWKAENRGEYSSGAGFSATENVFWNVGGNGKITSDQYGWGYIIGADDAMNVQISPGLGAVDGAPEDWVEEVPDGAVLTPNSLYESQLQKRLAP